MFLQFQHVRTSGTGKEVVIDVPRSDLRPEVMVYEAKTPSGKFAGLYREDDLLPITETVTFAQWDNYAKRIERKNLRECGRSLTFSGIANRANRFVIDIQPDHKVMIVKKGWREAMKQEVAPNAH